MARVKSLAALESIAATQTDADLVKRARQHFQQAVTSSETHSVIHHNYVISDRIVYTALSQFKSDSARSKAAKWANDQETFTKLEAELASLRHDYAITRSNKTAQSIRNLEVQVAQLRVALNTIAKEYRAEEHKALNLTP